MSQGLRNISNSYRVASSRILAGEAEIKKAEKEKRKPILGLGYWGAKDYMTRRNLAAQEDVDIAQS